MREDRLPNACRSDRGDGDAAEIFGLPPVRDTLIMGLEGLFVTSESGVK